MLPDVQRAVAEVRAAFAGHTVHVLEEEQGGANVIVDAVDLGAAFAPTTSWVGFSINFLYPRSDVYPHFVRPDLACAHGRPLPCPPLNMGHIMPGFVRPAIMVSRRSPRRDPARDTAALKLLRVVQWFREQGGAEQEAA